MENFTRKGNGTDNQESTVFQSIAVFFAAVNIFVSFTASLGNILILVALHKVSSVQPPTKLLFRCLAVTDLCVGLIVQPLYVISDVLAATIIISSSIRHYLIEIQNASAFALCGISALQRPP